MVCCEVMAVYALEKPPWSRCANQCAGGCGIYAERPEECRTFDCGWLKGMLSESEQDRPDRNGMMFVIWTPRRIWTVEVRPQAFRAETVRRAAEQYPASDWEIFLHKGTVPMHADGLFVHRADLDQLDELIDEYRSRWQHKSQ